MGAHVALQVIDNVLIDFSVGQVLLYVFVLSVLAAVVLQSWRVVGVQTVVFGLLLVATPGSLLSASGNGTPLALTAPQFRLFGVFLLLAGPVVLTVLAR
jgi:uncharacterized protein YjeT (DUF2065 family)